MIQDNGLGFARSDRLLRPAEFRAVFSDPIKAADRYFTVLCLPNGQDIPRLGMAVSKKNSRLAVDRNRIKRIIRESFRHNKSFLDGLDCVVISRSGLNTVANQELYSSLDRLWGKLKKKAAEEGA